MENQSNNPYSYHPDEPSSQQPSPSHEPPASDTDSEHIFYSPHASGQQAPASASETIKKAGRTVRDIIFCIIYIFIGALFLIAGGGLGWYTILHPAEYESLKMIASVLGICLFFIFCGILIILNGIKFIWKKP